MERTAVRTNCARALTFVIVGMLTAAQVVAAQPPWAGDGKGEKGEHREKPDNRKDRQWDGDKGVHKGKPEDRGSMQRDRDDRDERSDRDRAGPGSSRREHFEDRHRTLVRDYYREEFRHGRCPPGLARKDNGCMPPGHAKRWTIGRPLPREVIYYDLPPALIVQFDRPPQGYRYVRVASDILLIALGTGMVIDAIQDLERM